MNPNFMHTGWVHVMTCLYKHMHTRPTFSCGIVISDWSMHPDWQQGQSQSGVSFPCKVSASWPRPFVTSWLLMQMGDTDQAMHYFNLMEASSPVTNEAVKCRNLMNRWENRLRWRPSVTVLLSCLCLCTMCSFASRCMHYHFIDWFVSSFTCSLNRFTI